MGGRLRSGWTGGVPTAAPRGLGAAVPAAALHGLGALLVLAACSAAGGVARGRGRQRGADRGSGRAAPRGGRRRADEAAGARACADHRRPDHLGRGQLHRRREGLLPRRGHRGRVRPQRRRPGTRGRRRPGRRGRRRRSTPSCSTPSRGASRCASSPTTARTCPAPRPRHGDPQGPRRRRRVPGPASAKGWRIASATQGSITGHRHRSLASRAAASGRSDVEQVYLSFPDTAAAFANRAIQAAYYQEPFTTIAVDRGLIVRGPIAYEIYPYQQIGVLLFGERLLQDRALSQRHVRAYVRGVRDYVKAMIDRDPAVFDEVVPILIEHTTVKDRALFEKAIPSGLKADPVPNVQSMSDDQELVRRPRLPVAASERPGHRRAVVRRAGDTRAGRRPALTLARRARRRAFRATWRETTWMSTTNAGSGARRRAAHRRRHRRHLHRRGRLRRELRPAAARQVVEHAARPGRGHPAGHRRGRRRPGAREPGAARLDGRHQRHPGAQGRADRPGHDPGLPRRLRDRPHQPPRVVQPLLPQARAARAAQPPLRGGGAAERARATCRSRSTRRRPRRWRATWWPRASRAWPSSSCTATAIRSTSSDARSAAAVAPDLFVTLSHELSREYREYERTQHDGGERLRRPDRAAVSGPSGPDGAGAGLPWAAAAGAEQRRAVRRGDGARAVHPDAGVGPAAGVAGTEALCVTLALPTRSASTWAARR